MSSQLIGESVFNQTSRHGLGFELMKYQILNLCQFSLMLVLTGLLVFFDIVCKKLACSLCLPRQDLLHLHPKRPSSGLFGNVAWVEKPVYTCVCACVLVWSSWSQKTKQNWRMKELKSYRGVSTECPPTHGTRFTASRRGSLQTCTSVTCGSCFG